ncbi:MAG: SsrA-binding protein SmpB [Myxococcota bacterium]
MATGGKAPEIVSITKNRRAYFDYAIEEEIEAGMVLTGTEVKSMREGKAQLSDGFAQVDQGEMFLHQTYVAEYTQGNVFNHEPRRTRKLLLKKVEIERLHRKVQEKGYTLIPLELYFKRGRAKVRLGLCKGKKQYDKRATIKAKDQRRDDERDG